MLAGCNLGTRLTVGDDAHAFDTLWNAHLGVKDTSVGREVHTTDVVGRERGVLKLYPSLALSEFILNACGIVGQYLVQTDILGSLSHHHRSTCQQDTAKQQSESIHLLCIII